jgi:hypothetical protein
MRHVIAAGGAWLAVLLTPPAIPVPTQAPASAAVPHVMLIVEENRSESDVIGSPDAPYVNGLAQRYGRATMAFAQSHPSLPNYLELLSGSTQGVTDDGTGYSFAAETLVGQLQSRGIGWRGYMEGMPSACYSGAGTNAYAKKHDPFMYFTAITQNAGTCANVVPFSKLRTDLESNTAPPFLWVTPDLCHDGHDCSTATMDGWLASELPRVLASAWYARDGMVIITWDEGASGAGCCGGAHGGQVATIVVSSRVAQHVEMTAPVDHAGTLRTLEKLYGLSFLGDAACTCSGNLDVLAGTAAPAGTGYTWLTVPHLR